MALRCRDIPQLPGLEAIRLRGGESGADNEVRWPYLAENRSFKSWVRGSELVFVTGISRHRSPENLAECLHEGKTCGIAGLVVLTGDAYIGQLPAMLSRLADELVIPLFEQPYSLPMVEVTETISRAIIRAEQAARQPPADTLAQALAAEIGSEQLEALINRYLPLDTGALAEDRHTLEAWLTYRGNQCAIAKALGCHRNTIRNRINRLLAGSSHGAGPTEHFKNLLLTHLLSRPL